MTFTFESVNGACDLFIDSSLKVMSHKEGEKLQALLPSDEVVTAAAGVGMNATVEVGESNIGNLTKEESDALDRFLDEHGGDVESVFDASVSTENGSVSALNKPVPITVSNDTGASVFVLRLHENGEGTVSADQLCDATTNEELPFEPALFSKYLVVKPGEAKHQQDANQEADKTVDDQTNDLPAPTNPTTKDQEADKTSDDQINGSPAQTYPTIKEQQAAILAQKKDGDIKGSTFYLLQAKKKKVKNTSITIAWKKVKGAESYTVFASKCGQKFKNVKTLNKTSYTYSKLKKGTYYKFNVVANGGDKALATSKVLYIATSGGKVGNPSSVTVKKSSVSVKKNNKTKANASLKNGKATVKKHRKLSYESSNKEIATVDKNGVIKGKKKGTCYVYAYAQNGVFAKIKVKVK